jgi:hypothetical protein
MMLLLRLALFALALCWLAAGLTGCVYCEQQSTCHVTSMPMVNTTATIPVSALPGLP